tara:strand:- start:485 stop:691 length:207 start_codon:yes stop_codon:yes gene_type:complete
MGMIKKALQILWKQDPQTDIYNEPNPGDLNIENAYKTRWVWYHTFMVLELLIIIFLLGAILTTLAIKL